MLSNDEKRPFRMPFGIALEGQRFGCVVDKFSESYSYEKVEGIPYNYGCRIFASRERIFPLFTALSAFVSDPCTLLLFDSSLFEDESHRSPAIAKSEIMGCLTQHSFQLVNDGNLAFFLESDDFEVSVQSHKELEVFAQSMTQALEVFREHGIPKDPKTSLFRNAPHDHVSISRLFEDKKTRARCEPLPKEEVERYEADPKAYKDFFQEIVRRLRMKVEEEE